MKKLYLDLALLVLSLCLTACNGSKTAENSDSNNENIQGSSTAMKKGETYTGKAYDRYTYQEGNVSVTIGDTEFTSDNEKIKLVYSVSIYNASKKELEFSVSDVKLFSNKNAEFTSYCATTFDGKELTDDLRVDLYGGKSAKLRFSANFSDEEKDNDTAYYNTFVLKDSDGNVYNMTVSCEDESVFYEWKTVTLYENSEYTLENGFNFVTEGTSGYNESGYCFESSEVLSITNNGSDASCLFNTWSLEMYSVSDNSSVASVSGSAKLNDENFYSYHDNVSFTTGSVFKLDLTDTYYGVSESDLPVKVCFSIKNASEKTNYKIVLILAKEK